jgi:hypothetical protein
LAKINKELI